MDSFSGELEEEFYVDQREGFVVSKKEENLCGLKQVPKLWQ